MYLWLIVIFIFGGFLLLNSATITNTSEELTKKCSKCQVPMRSRTWDGIYDFFTGQTHATFGNLCLTCKPYYNENDSYWWWRYQPYYWQKKYQHCDKYGCGGSHDKSLCPEETALKPLDCSAMKYTPYDSRGYGWTDKEFYQNRASFCSKNPNHIYCPNSFDASDMTKGLSDCPTSAEAWSTIPIG